MKLSKLEIKFKAMIKKSKKIAKKAIKIRLFSFSVL